MLAILIVTIQSTGLIATEKSKQTLDVLLTTPLPSRDIALQKLAGLLRLATLAAVGLICFGPSLTMRAIESTQASLSSSAKDSDDQSVINIGGPITRPLSEDIDVSSEFVPRPVWRIALGWLRPLRVLFPGSFAPDYGELPFGVWFPLLFHFAMFLGTLCLLRRNALAHFGRWVHRTEAASGWRATSVQ